MLFVLSVIAELLRQNPKFYYPFTRKFLLIVFSIDAELLQSSPIKDNILAILSITTGVASLLSLLALHFASPEFKPGWRMVSEYAMGKYSNLY